jgi:hypothetical protein
MLPVTSLPSAILSYMFGHLFSSFSVFVQFNNRRASLSFSRYRRHLPLSVPPLTTLNLQIPNLSHAVPSFHSLYSVLYSYKPHFHRNVPFPSIKTATSFSPSERTLLFLDIVAACFNNMSHFSYFCPSVSSSSFSLPIQPSTFRCPTAARNTAHLISSSLCFTAAHWFATELSTFPLLLYLPGSLSSTQLAALAGILNIFLQNLRCARSTISHPIYYQNVCPTQQPR